MGVSINGDNPRESSWFIRYNPNLQWMIWRYTPICGNLHAPMVNGNFRILKWRYVSTIFQAIHCGDPFQGLL